MIGRTRCGGYAIGPIRVEWARGHTEYTRYMFDTSRLLGVMPELQVAQTVEDRWHVMRALLRQLRASSILDVGGIGTYGRAAPVYKCLNIATEPRAHRARCVIYNGSHIPFSNKSFELSIAETALHHAAHNSSAVLAEMARVSRRYVVVSEDILERSMASSDVVEAFRQHDPNAKYRSLAEWTSAGEALGLSLERFIVLHRVPLHLTYLRPCHLGYAPMAYFVWRHPR